MSSLTIPPTAIAADKDAVYIATGPTLISQPLDSNSKATALPPSSGLIRKIALSPDGKHAASVGDDKSLRIYSLNPFAQLSTRTTNKRCSDVSFAPSGDILVSDKVGDTYLYPFTPRVVSTEARPTATILNSDPSKNPDADLVLGHVSIITEHIVSPDGKHIITADRDEHIRVSRFPQSYVVERYLLGSQGFISAIHIPSTRPDVLLSAGGEDALRIWKWQTGEQVGSIPLWDAVRPHRKVRSTLRKTRKPRKSRAEQEGDEFYTAPEGFILPSGIGMCIRKIDSVVVGEETVVVFYSEGASAIHAFVLPEDVATVPQITTLALPHPIVDFTQLVSSPGQLLVSIDPAFGVLRQNQTGSNNSKKPQVDLSAEQTAELSKNLVAVEVGSGASLSLSENPIVPALLSTLSTSGSTTQNALSTADLYPDLALYPRWIGLEEDDELAGTSENQETQSIPGTPDPSIDAKKEWTREELETLGPRQLGRLKAQGVDVGDLLSRKRMKKMKVENTQAMEKKVQAKAERRKAADAKEEARAKEGKEGKSEEGEEGKSEQVAEEEAVNQA